jgi:hypothetical protein
MKPPQHNQVGPALTVRSLVIQTDVPMCPNYRTRVNQFVPPGSVDWMSGMSRTEMIVPTEVHGKPKRLDDEEKTLFHLVRYGAITITSMRRGSDTRIVSIVLNPAMALYGKANHPLDDDDLARAQALLKESCGPLLADPADVRHLVPGEVGEDEEPVAVWRSFKCEAWYPGIELAHIHYLSHPEAGSAEGRKLNFARLVPELPGCLISFKRVKRKVDGSDTKVPGLMISLELGDQELAHRQRRHGSTARVRNRVRHGFEDVRRLCREVISELEGYYLPVPAQWAAKPGTAKFARMICLVAAFTERTPAELLMSPSIGQNVCRRTVDRLRRRVPKELALLKPVPLAAVLSPGLVGQVAPPEVRMDARIAASCGPDSPT